MGNRGQAKKKLEKPPAHLAGGKRIGGSAASLLPGAATSGERLCWRFEHVDHDGRWGFCDMEPDTWREVMKKMTECESMTIAELRNTWRLFKEYELPGGLCKEAWDRLVAMKRDDQTKIQRLEFTGTQRLYGFLEGNVFHVVWWDANHEVYPAKLRNT